MNLGPATSRHAPPTCPRPCATELGDRQPASWTWTTQTKLASHANCPNATASPPRKCESMPTRLRCLRFPMVSGTTRKCLLRARLQLPHGAATRCRPHACRQPRHDPTSACPADRVPKSPSCPNQLHRQPPAAAAPHLAVLGETAASNAAPLKATALEMALQSCRLATPPVD